MKAAEKRERKIGIMLEKGMEILWANGYNGTSVNDIVSAANVPKGSFYFYFESKDDFVIKALERYFEEECVPALAVLREKNLPPEKRLLNFYHFRNEKIKKDLNCEKGSMTYNISNEMSEHNDDIRKKVQQLHEKANQIIVQVAAEAQANGTMKTDIDTKKMVDFIENVFHGALIKMKENQSGAPLDDALDIVKMTFFK